MKNVIMLIIILLIFTLTACSENAVTRTDSDPTTAISETSSAAPSESVTEESTPDSTPAVSVSPQTSQKPKDNPPPATSKPTDPPKTNPPASSQPPAATSKPPEQPKRTDPPATSTPTPAFNAQTYYDYAMTYAKSIGLKYYPDMNLDENAWNAPVNLYSALTDDTMKKNVRSSCDFIKREGFEYFGLYLEKQSDGTSYRLYVMYG